MSRKAREKKTMHSLRADRKCHEDSQWRWLWNPEIEGMLPSASHCRPCTNKPSALRPLMSLHVEAEADRGELPGPPHLVAYETLAYLSLLWVEGGGEGWDTALCRRPVICLH